MYYNISNYKNIELLKFKCSILTPIFSYGVQNKIPEIRASSIKGLLRFWWRAIAGINYNNILELYKNESMLFGDSGKFGKSKLKISIDSSKNIKIYEYNPLPHKNINLKFKCFLPDEESYIYFTLTFYKEYS